MANAEENTNGILDSCCVNLASSKLYMLTVVVCATIYIIKFATTVNNSRAKILIPELFNISAYFAIFFGMQAISQLVMSLYWDIYKDKIKIQHNFDGFTWLLVSIPNGLMNFIFFDSFTIKIWSCSQFLKCFEKDMPIENEKPIIERLIERVQKRRNYIRLILVLTMLTFVITKSCFIWAPELEARYEVFKKEKELIAKVVFWTFIVLIVLFGFLFIHFVVVAQKYVNVINKGNP